MIDIGSGSSSQLCCASRFMIEHCRLLPQDASARVAEVEATAAKASRELAEYKAESSELRNQDLTIRRLEERVRSLEADLLEKVSSGTV